MKLLRIAIDGPGGSGKSTLAKRLSADYGIPYVDTGAMYRAIGYKIGKLNVPMEECPQMEKLVAETDIDFRDGKIFLDGDDVSSLIRTREVSMLASKCSALPTVRRKLVAIQRKIGAEKSVVMDGRDIGTNVMPDAEYKFFVTASPEERAKRRYLELKEKGLDPDYDEVLREINIRDKQDSTRELNPLCRADDAVLVDTTDMDIEQSVNVIKKIIDAKTEKMI
ncbi:MAG: (d)CMP kinase [Eubacterium sp.]